MDGGTSQDPIPPSPAAWMMHLMTALGGRISLSQGDPPNWLSTITQILSILNGLSRWYFILISMCVTIIIKKERP